MSPADSASFSETARPFLPVGSGLETDVVGFDIGLIALATAGERVLELVCDFAFGGSAQSSPPAHDSIS